MPPAKKMSDQRFVLSMTPELRERVRKFRFRAEINTESEALRTLIEAGLKALDKEGRGDT